MEEYLFQAKPAPQAQGVGHGFRVIFNTSNCKKSEGSDPVRCQDGYHDDGNGLFGQLNCVKN